MNRTKSMENMSTEERVAKFTDVKETPHGLRELNDFNNLFGYNIKLPSETVGKLRTMSLAEIAEAYPEASSYLKGVKHLTNYIKTHGGSTSVDSFAFRVHHIQAFNIFLDVVSRLQFIRALNDQIGVYKEDAIGWGVFDLEYVYKHKKLVDTTITIGGVAVNLSKPVRIQAIDWYGRLVEGIQIVDRNLGKADRVARRDENGGLVVDEDTGKVIYDDVPLPVNIAIQICDDSLSNTEHYETLYQRDGAINKSDIQDTLLFSPINFMVMRIANDEQDDIDGLFPVGYETPIFRELDYSHEIDFGEHIRVLERYNQLREQDQFYNSREFATLNLLRWGIVDKATWDRGLKIYNAVLNAPAVWGVDTPVDGKVVQWGNNVLQELESRPENKGRDIRDDVIMSGSAISKIASVSSQSYFRVRVLLVESIADNDVTFRDTYVTFRYKRERTSKFQSLSRLNTDVYKIIECDKDGNLLGIVNPVDVFAIVNHDITAVVVRLEATFSAGAELGEVVPQKEHLDYYNSLSNYKG